VGIFRGRRNVELCAAWRLQKCPKCHPLRRVTSLQLVGSQFRPRQAAAQSSCSMNVSQLSPPGSSPSTLSMKPKLETLEQLKSRTSHSLIRLSSRATKPIVFLASKPTICIRFARYLRHQLPALIIRNFRRRALNLHTCLARHRDATTAAMESRRRGHQTATIASQSFRESSPVRHAQPGCVSPHHADTET
jgi:hypothetical protein